MSYNLSSSNFGSSRARRTGTNTTHTPTRGTAAAPHGGITATRAVVKDSDSGLDDGWGIEVTTQPSTSSRAGPSTKPPARKAKAPGTPQTAQKPAAKPRSRSPFMDLTSEQGILGLTMLQQKLKRAEQGQAGLTSADTKELIDSLPKMAQRRAAAKRTAAVAPQQTKARKVLVYEDDDGNTWEAEEDEDVTDKPRFELNLVDDDMVRGRKRKGKRTALDRLFFSFRHMTHPDDLNRNTSSMTARATLSAARRRLRPTRRATN